MSWMIDSLTIKKDSQSTGEVSIKFDDGAGNFLSINKVQVDLNDGANPVQILKAQGTPVVAGNVIDAMKDVILEICQGPLSGETHGLFKCSNGEIERL